MNVMATTRQSTIGQGNPPVGPAEFEELRQWLSQGIEIREEVLLVSLELLLRESDVISLHCPLTEQTKHLINAQTLAQMKPTALLLNTARGAIVNEADLAVALNEGRLAGAGVDVLSVEPPPASNPLLRAKNCLITPHIAWASRPARARLMRLAAENLRSFLNGQPRNVVN
jgi:glycerate dehydrogenase